MSRCECHKESSSQSLYSPGLVLSEEAIVYVLVDPLSFEDGSIKSLRHDHLKKSQMSVVRASFITGTTARALTVEVMVANNNQRVDCGYAYAMCQEIREIRLGQLGVGAFCVIDDAFEHFPAHAHIGYSNTDDKKNDRLTARGNLLLLFKKRGIFENWAGVPFFTAEPRRSCCLIILPQDGMRAL